MRIHRLVPGPLLFLLGIVTAATNLSAAEPPLDPGSDDPAAPTELVQLAEEFRDWLSDTRSPDRVPDYGDVDREQRRGLAEYRERLDAMADEIRGHPVPVQVDYMVLQIEMNRLQFDLEAVRQVTRNPDFYLNEAVRRVTRHVGGRYHQGPNHITVPYDGERAQAIIRGLDQTSEIVAQAPDLLTEAVPEMAEMTIERLDDPRSSYAEFARVVGQHVPERYRGELTEAADRAGQALEEYRDWLVANRDGMTAPWYIGRDAFDWYAQHVYVMPYDSDQLLMHAEMERNRNWAYLQMERQRNRHLPRAGGVTDVPSRSAVDNDEFADWKDATDVMTREWILEHDLLEIPDYVGRIRQERSSETAAYIQPFGFMGFPTEQLEPGEKRKFVLEPDHHFENNYWNTGHRIDPGVNHPHSDIPGHTYEGRVSRATTRDLRVGHNTRGDALPFYWEHVQLQMDYPFVRGPLIREWMFGLLIMRAERVEIAVHMAAGTMTPDEVGQYMLDNVPWMEPYVGIQHEVWRKFTRPVSVLDYQVASFQVMSLLRERMQQLGDDFDFREFHHDLMATGMIPISLARWEMTGEDDHVSHLWDTPEVPRLVEEDR